MHFERVGGRSAWCSCRGVWRLRSRVLVVIISGVLRAFVAVKCVWCMRVDVIVSRGLTYLCFSSFSSFSSLEIAAAGFARETSRVQLASIASTRVSISRLFFMFMSMNFVTML